MSGYGFIRRVGWMKNDEGREFFGMVIEYTDGSPEPDLGAGYVWNDWPVIVIPAPRQPDKSDNKARHDR